MTETLSPAPPPERATQVYHMREPWQSLNLVLGWWMWLMVFAELIGSGFLLLLFPWARQIGPAFRRMWAGEHRSYLQISSTGLVYRLWPFAELRANWEQVARLQRGRWLGDSLVLREAAVVGFPEFSFTLGAFQIHLSSFSGWPTGNLEAALRSYAPDLFIR